MPLTDSQIARYERQILLPEVGGRGQEALLSATIRVNGCGETADEAATYLAAGGIGKLILDSDFPIERRQFLESSREDLQLSSDGHADLCLDCGTSNDRFLGAQKALQAMLHCVGAAGSQEWKHESSMWWTS